MSNLRLGIWSGLLVANLGLIALFGQPARSQEIGSKTEAKREVTSLLADHTVSQKAIDLLSSSSKNSLRDRASKSYQIAQNESNLEKFCQNYPYNAQCGEISPTNSEPIPVPVPPPAPPGSNNRNSINAQKTGWAIVPEVSTLGLGGHVVKRIIPQVNARVGLNTFGLGFDIEDTDADYEGDLNLFNVSTILDLHPSQNSGFKLSGGAIFANNNIEGTAVTDQIIEIGDDEFSEDVLSSVDADVDISSNVAPYVGLGWGNAVGANKGLGLWFNAGVMFGGSPDVDISPNINQGVSEDIVNEINAAAAAEEEELEDELGLFKVYPVVSLGISYQF